MPNAAQVPWKSLWDDAKLGAEVEKGDRQRELVNNSVFFFASVKLIDLMNTLMTLMSIFANLSVSNMAD